MHLIKSRLCFFSNLFYDDVIMLVYVLSIVYTLSGSANVIAVSPNVM